MLFLYMFSYHNLILYKFNIRICNLTILIKPQLCNTRQSLHSYCTTKLNVIIHLHNTLSALVRFYHFYSFVHKPLLIIINIYFCYHTHINIITKNYPQNHYHIYKLFKMTMTVGQTNTQSTISTHLLLIPTSKQGGYLTYNMKVPCYYYFILNK